MATKKEIAAECIEIAEKLGIEVETEGLNHEKLSELLTDLKAKEKDAETVSQADAAEAKAKEEAEAKAAKKAAWVIAEGKTITSKKGVLDSGEEVKAEYLGGGEAAFKTLVEAKIIVKG